MDEETTSDPYKTLTASTNVTIEFVRDFFHQKPLADISKLTQFAIEKQSYPIMRYLFEERLIVPSEHMLRRAITKTMVIIILKHYEEVVTSLQICQLIIDQMCVRKKYYYNDTMLLDFQILKNLAVNNTGHSIETKIHDMYRQSRRQHMPKHLLSTNTYFSYIPRDILGCVAQYD